MNSGGKIMWLGFSERLLFEIFQEQEKVNYKRLVWRHALVVFFPWECIDTIKEVPLGMLSLTVLNWGSK